MSQSDASRARSRLAEIPAANSVVAEGPVAFPDLSTIPTGSLRSQLRQAWPDDAPPDSQRFELVRLGEKALWDYNAARAHYLAWVERGALENAMGCVDRLEDCINATDRGLRCLKAVIKQPAERSPNLERALKGEFRAHKARRTALRGVRDELYAAHNRPAVGAQARLSFDHAQVTACRHALSYRDLELLVRALHTMIHEITTNELRSMAPPAKPPAGGQRPGDGRTWTEIASASNRTAVGGN
jgi:hypothetical protein